jgi:hypothetical protein
MSSAVICLFYNRLINFLKEVLFCLQVFEVGNCSVVDGAAIENCLSLSLAFMLTGSSLWQTSSFFHFRLLALSNNENSVLFIAERLIRCACVTMVIVELGSLQHWPAAAVVSLPSLWHYCWLSCTSWYGMFLRQGFLVLFSWNSNFYLWYLSVAMLLLFVGTCVILVTCAWQLVVVGENFLQNTWQNVAVKLMRHFLILHSCTAQPTNNFCRQSYWIVFRFSELERLR